MENKIVMYTDGGARNNPGPAGIGVWIETLKKEYSEYLGEKTNNEAEYEALIFGMKKVKSLLGKDKSKRSSLECRLDSELIVKQLTHQYKIKEERIQKYFIEIWNMMLDFGNVSFVHVPREKNKVADRLVNEAVDAAMKQRSLF